MQQKHWMLMIVSTIVFIIFGYFAVNALSPSNTSTDGGQDTSETDETQGIETDTSTTSIMNDEEEITRENDETIIVIDDKEFNQDDVDFLKYLQLAQIDYFEAEADENWDDARRIQASDNTQIQNLIELHMMESLGEEKGYEFSDEDLEEAIKEFQDQFSDTENYAAAEELVGQDFDERFETYILQRMTVDHIIEDLRAMVLQEFPETRDEDVAHEAGKEYQLLLADERTDHKIRVFNEFD